MSNFNLALLREKNWIWLLFLSVLLMTVTGCFPKQLELRKQPVTPLIQLPAVKTSGTVSLEEAIARRRSIRQFASDSLPLTTISQLLWAAQGVTEPEKGFRAAPSAGAIYPLELFLIVKNVASLSPGIYLYHPRPHSLEIILENDQLIHSSEAVYLQSFVANAPAVIAIIGVFSRTAKRYGAKAEEYVYLEAGHAGQNIYLQAGTLGLGTVGVGAFSKEKLAKSMLLLESETPLYLFPVGEKNTP